MIRTRPRGAGVGAVLTTRAWLRSSAFSRTAPRPRKLGDPRQSANASFQVGHAWLVSQRRRRRGHGPPPVARGIDSRSSQGQPFHRSTRSIAKWRRRTRMWVAEPCAVRGGSSPRDSTTVGRHTEPAVQPEHVRMARGLTPGSRPAGHTPDLKRPQKPQFHCEGSHLGHRSEAIHGRQDW